MRNNDEVRKLFVLVVLTRMEDEISADGSSSGACVAPMEDLHYISCAHTSFGCIENRILSAHITMIYIGLRVHVTIERLLNVT